MAEILRPFIHDLIDAWNSHDIDQVAKFYAESYIGDDVAQATPHRGPEGTREFLARYLRAFPDFQFTADEIVADGDRAVLIWTARATHRGALMSIPPTGRPIKVSGVSILTIHDNQVQRATYIWDVAGLLRNIGLLPDL